MQVTIKVIFNIELDHKEFSLMARCLAGHKLSDSDLIKAKELNVKLLQQRSGQLESYKKQSARALEVAEDEAKYLEELPGDYDAQ